ncbi:MAG TPA: CPBP family intramembrane glutamic endopeptidase [Chloroflexota bacterium]|jgi:hypothetical protein|nr:CPBP family intramembrane glutamic endopeptidase [Chloroflexota bacterium]
MSAITALFWDRGAARLRAGWRVLVFWAGWLALFLVVSRLSDTVLAGRLPVAYRNAVEIAVLVLLVGGVLVWLVGSRLLDRRPVADYGFHLSRGWWLDLGFGMALATVLMLGMFAVDLAMGWVRITGTFATSDPGQPFAPAILAGFLAAALVAVHEEVTWRAYSVKNLAEGLNGRALGPRWATAVAVLVASAWFGLAHADNADATAFSTANTMAIAVLVLAAGYVLTGELALPIGFHVAWNFVQVFVLGFHGGAARYGASVLVVAEGDPAGRPWTGMPYAHEGGLLSTGMFVLGFVLIAAWVRVRRGGVGVHPSLAQPPPRPAIGPTRLPAAAGVARPG